MFAMTTRTPEWKLTNGETTGHERHDNEARALARDLAAINRRYGFKMTGPVAEIVALGSSLGNVVTRRMEHFKSPEYLAAARQTRAGTAGREGGAAASGSVGEAATPPLPNGHAPAPGSAPEGHVIVPGIGAVKL